MIIIKIAIADKLRLKDVKPYLYKLAIMATMHTLIDDKDTILDARNTAKKTSNITMAKVGLIYIRAPKTVAIPLPALKLSTKLYI